MILQGILYAASLFILAWMATYNRRNIGREPGGFGHINYVGFLLAVALFASAATNDSPVVAGILLALALVYPFACRYSASLEAQRDMLQSRTRALSQSLETLDESASSRIASGESRFHDLAAVVPVGIFETDPHTNLVYVNKLLGQMTGMGARETRARGFHPAIHQDERQDIALKWQTCLREKSVFEEVFRFGSNEEFVWVVCLAQPRFLDGEFTGYVGMCMDVTERKKQGDAERQLEEQTRRADRLESLGVFASGIAHDFNNLLVPILGGADHLLRELPAESSLHGIANRLSEAAGQAADLAAQMLAYTGTVVTEHEAIKLDSFMEDLQSSIDAANQQSAEVCYEAHGNTGCTVDSNPAQLRQAIMNLVANAFEATESISGRVIVRYGTRAFSSAGLQELHLEHKLAEGELPFIEIEDNGEGIARSEISRIFDPFYTSRFTGRGLGLAVVSGIIKSIGGGIKLDSSTSKGTCITVIFPLDSARLAATSESTSQDETPDSAGFHILVVDDELGVREFVKTMLEAKGYYVSVAEDGPEGIALFHRRPQSIHAVIVDLTMPTMDGEEVIDHLVEIRSDVPVLVTSGYAESDVLARLAHRRVSGFLAKPFRESELLESVSRLVSECPPL